MRYLGHRIMKRIRKRSYMKTTRENRETQLKDPNLGEIMECFKKNKDEMGMWSKRAFIINDCVLYCYNNEE